MSQNYICHSIQVINFFHMIYHNLHKIFFKKSTVLYSNQNGIMNISHFFFDISDWDSIQISRGICKIDFFVDCRRFGNRAQVFNK